VQGRRDPQNGGFGRGYGCEGASDEKGALSLEVDLNHLPQRKRFLA
jgi:hypothetical protein